MSATRLQRPQFGAAPRRGLFNDGTWLCDCDPRQNAKHFQVKKAGPNIGRWFYVCPKPKDDHDCCKFFLWDEDAQPRARQALLTASRAEPDPRVPDTPTKIRQKPITPPPAYSVSQQAAIGNKRKQSSSEEEYGLSSEGSFESELGRAAEAVDTPRPSKMARKAPNTTPRQRKLPWVTEPRRPLPTPQTESRIAKGSFTDIESAISKDPFNPFAGRTAAPDTSFATPSRPRVQPRDPPSARSDATISPDTTPTPNRFRDAVVGGTEDELAKDVFNVLSDNRVGLNQETRTSLRRVLTTHSLRTQGILKGRDVGRLAIKAKDAKITELQHRINTLQAELETERALVQNLRWKADTGHQSDS